MKRRIVLSKSEMLYYRALKRTKKSAHEYIENLGIGWMHAKSLIENYDALCARIDALREKGWSNRCPAIWINTNGHQQRCRLSDHADDTPHDYYPLDGITARRRR